MQTLKNLLAVILLGLATSVALADLEPGQTLRPVDIKLLGGETLSAQQLAGKPAVYLFWATWCGVCIEELPSYQALHNAYKARGFRVIAISLDKSASDAAEFWKDNGYTFPVAMRTDEMREGFGGIKGTPTLYLIDKAGRLKLKHLGGIPMDELEARIKDLL